MLEEREMDRPERWSARRKTEADHLNREVEAAVEIGALRHRRIGSGAGSRVDSQVEPQAAPVNVRRPRPIRAGVTTLRRVLADLGEDHTTDTRVLREVTGWKSEETRKIYQRKRNPKVLKGAAETRHRVRRSLRAEDGTRTDASPPPIAPPDLSSPSNEELQALIDAAAKRLKGDS